ncbi:MAG: nickel insertion protein, partial [Anaerovorax sp.]
IQMKKNRPAVQLTVLCKEAVANALSEIIFEETGTLGIRICQRQRLILPRDVRVINTEFGPIRAKVSKIKGKDSFKPEFEDCAEIAKKYALSLKEVQDRIRKSISR